MAASRLSPQKAPNVSFEFFPPATPQMEATLWDSIKRLAPLRPNFVSVTYGAGGSTRERTHATVSRIIRETDIRPAAHLTCVAATRAEVDDVIRAYHDAGVRHIVALRGDPQGGLGTAYAPHPGGYETSTQLIEGIRRIGDFEVSVSAYPEKHPESATIDADIRGRRRHRRDQHLRRDQRDRDAEALQVRRAHRRPQPRRRALARAAPPSAPSAPTAAALRRRLDRADQPTASMSPDVNDPGFRAITFASWWPPTASRPGLVDGGADLLLSRPSSTRSTPRRRSSRSPSCSRRRRRRVPVMISGTITDARAARCRARRRGVLDTRSPRRPFAVGLNCALGAERCAPTSPSWRASPTR
jgi:hypothetical protein